VVSSVMAGTVGRVEDLLGNIHQDQSDVLNNDADTALRGVLKTGEDELRLLSDGDVDHQLLLRLVFKDKAKLAAIAIEALARPPAAGEYQMCSF